MKQTSRAGVELVVLSPQSADRAQKQATADKVKFNLLVDANKEVGKAFGVVYTFPEDLKNGYWLELPSSFPLTGDIAANSSTGR
jgi:peroxiredoxin